MRMLASNTPVPVLAERNRIGHTNSNRATENKTDVQNSKKDVLLHRPSLLIINYEIGSMDPTKLNLCIKISKIYLITTLQSHCIYPPPNEFQ